MNIQDFKVIQVLVTFAEMMQSLSSDEFKPRMEELKNLAKTVGEDLAKMDARDADLAAREKKLQSEKGALTKRENAVSKRESSCASLKERLDQQKKDLDERENKVAEKAAAAELRHIETTKAARIAAQELAKKTKEVESVAVKLQEANRAMDARHEAIKEKEERLRRALGDI